MILTFAFDKSSTIISGVFSIIIVLIVCFKIQLNILLNIWGYVLILIALLLYLTFNKYLEWKKNRIQHLKIVDENLIINDNFYSKLNDIKNINISYSANQFESGWTIYLKNFSKEYAIKKRLKESDALEITNKLADFLGKRIIRDN